MWQRLTAHYKPTTGANGTPPSTPETKPEEAGNIAGSTSGVKDPDKTVVDEEADEAVKRRFPWLTLTRDSSRRQAKGKELVRNPPLTDGTARKLDV